MLWILKEAQAGNIIWTDFEEYPDLQTWTRLDIEEIELVIVLEFCFEEINIIRYSRARRGQRQKKKIGKEPTFNTYFFLKRQLHNECFKASLFSPWINFLSL